VAVGSYHCRRGNPAGAVRQLRKALRKLEAYLPAYEGVNTAGLARDALALIQRIEAGAAVSEYPRISAA
jgi:predicted metal-dependent hydrolase